MNNLEAIDRIKDHMAVHNLHEPRAVLINEALKKAIESLSLEECDDCVSRKEVEKNVFNIIDLYESGRYFTEENGIYALGWDIIHEKRRVLLLSEVLHLTFNSIKSVRPCNAKNGDTL